MKILHVAITYVPAYVRGGPVVSIHNLCRQLAKSGHEVSVYTTNTSLWDNSEIELLKETDVDGVRVTYCPTVGRHIYAYSPGMYRLVKSTVGDFDIVHVHGTYTFPPQVGSNQAKKKGVPYVVTPRGMLMSDVIKMKSRVKKSVYIKLFGRRILENASGIHFTSYKEKKKSSELGLDLKKDVVIPNGVIQPDVGDIDPGIFKKKYNVSDGFIVLFMSRIHPGKGLDLLIPAFSRVVKEIGNAQLVLAGPDREGYGAKVRELIEEYGIGSHVTFTGLIKGADKSAALAASDVFILPSYSENFGNAPVEAMLAGLPIIVTDKVGMSEFIESGREGMIVKTDTEEIADALIRLAKMRELRFDIAENGRLFAVDNFSIYKTADKMAAFYSSICS